MSREVQRLEVTLSILEAKLQSIPGIENAPAPELPNAPAPLSAVDSTVTNSSVVVNNTPAAPKQEEAQGQNFNLASFFLTFAMSR